MPREWYSCGAAFHAFRISLIREWRATHHCPDRPDVPPMLPSGAESSTQLSYQQIDLTDQHTIGFRAEG